MKNYLVVTTKSWNIENFYTYTKDLPGNWHLVTEAEQLTKDYIQSIEPEFIFFPHWSWIVPESIVNQYQCICFHMTDLPFGRGGSPLQHLIQSGYKITQLTVLKMTDQLDGGPIYFKYPLTLDGSAEDILKRASLLSYKAMGELINNPTTPQEQQGKVTEFKRRKPQESEIKNIESQESFYNHIRMLDAEGYPKAFLKASGFKIEFDNAKIIDGKLTASVTIMCDTKDEERF
jgi:methionyl-tRNA formyltransferase